MIARYGFGNRPQVDGWQERLHAELLNELVPLALQDVYESEPEDTGVVRELLNPWEIEAAREGVLLSADYFRRRGRMMQSEQEDWIEAKRQAERVL